MGITLNRLELLNFKLFEHEVFDFSRQLTIFDGPNGYGKTSVFDALELLITGNIKRIANSAVVNGKNKFKSNCLARDPSINVIVKGEFFKDSAQAFVIAIVIPNKELNGIDNNPQKLPLILKNYYLDNFDIPIERWSEFYCLDMDKKREDFFGLQNCFYYNLFHYISQENRLDYFNKSEKERSDNIGLLLGVDEYVKKQERTSAAIRKVRALKRQLQTSIEQRERDLSANMQPVMSEVAYNRLLPCDVAWDKENLPFTGISSKPIYELYRNELTSLMKLYENRDVFNAELNLDGFFAIPDRKKNYAIAGLYLRNKISDVYEDYEKRRADYAFIQEQIHLIEVRRFTEIKWNKLLVLVDKRESLSVFDNWCKRITYDRNNAGSTAKTLSELKIARNNLQSISQKADIRAQGKCPYCGAQWDTDIVLNDSFIKMGKMLEDMFQREDSMLSSDIEQCMEEYQKLIEPSVLETVERLQNKVHDDILKFFDNSQDFYRCTDACSKACKFMDIDVSEVNLDNPSILDNESILRILGMANESKRQFTYEYQDNCKQYQFFTIFDKYFKDFEELALLTVEKINAKIAYVDYKYIDSLNMDANIIIQDKAKLEKLDEVIHDLKIYEKAMSEAINKYKKNLISQIKIPFFFYSSRLLQSYPGGQGIFMKEDGKNIRFTSQSSEHDILYTMSSGQLSAINMAFTLTMNKIYSDNDFYSLFIDDPIQSMDDINMISFVELLAIEFSNSQILISTHENLFSQYISYKFDKYSLDNKTICLADKQLNPSV